MQRAAGQRPMTADELFALPDDGCRHELSLGYLLSEPPAGFDHGGVGVRILVLLDNHVRARALGRVVGADTGFVLARTPDTVRAPDAAFVSAGRLGAVGRVKGYFPGAPDLAVEVLSPSERAGTIHGKVADYLAAGTRVVWVVDPESRTVTIYRSLLSPLVLAGDRELDGGDVVPGFAVKVSEIFEI